MKPVLLIIFALLIIDTTVCPGADQSICNPGSTIDYHPNGQLRACSLKDIYHYGDISCNQYSTVRFYNSGKLESCTLSSQLEIDGKTCKELEALLLFETGKLKSCSKPN
jgi:antitoxin component YwqK of YwqJK toxin-antitoxin module